MVLLDAVRWINPAGGNWGVAANWDAGRVPGAGDDVTINMPGATITHSTGTDSVHSLTLTNGTLALSGGILQNISTLQDNAVLNLSGGTLGGVSMIQGGGTFNFSRGTLLNSTVAAGTTVTGTGNQMATLNGVTLNGNLDLTSGNPEVLVTNGLTLNGAAALGNSSGSTFGELLFVGTQTLDGSGSILLGAYPAYNFNGLYEYQPGSATLTIGPNITIHGKTGIVAAYYSGNSVINQGTITADVSGGTITVSFGSNGSNSGTLAATNEGTLTLGGTWANSGTIRANSGTLNLGGNFNLAAGSTLTTSGGTVNLTGTLNNTNTTLTLNASTGSWNFSGRINGGTVSESGGAALVILTAYPSTLAVLDGVTLDGDLDLTGAPRRDVTVLDGLTLNGTAYLGNAAGTTRGNLWFSNTETFDGHGTVLFGGTSDALNLLYIPSSSITVTLGANLTVHGKNGQLYGQFTSDTFINQATINADTAGGTITVNPTTWTNSGTVRAQNGGILSATAPTNYASGTLTGGTWQVYDTSTLRVAMSAGLVTNAATILLDGATSHFYQAASGTTDALAALATNAGSLTVQNSRTFTSTADLMNSGTLLIGPGGTVTVTGTYTEAGTLNVRATGVMSVAGALANFDGANLSGGTYRIAGTFQFPGAAIATNAATLVLDGSASQIIDQNGNDALAGLAANSGSLTLQNGRNLSLAGNFSDSDTLSVGVGTFTINGTYTEQGSVTVQAGASLIVAGSFANFDGANLNGGTFDLLGTLQFPGANLQGNAATLVLDGASAQILDQNGNNGLANLALNAVSGSLTLQNGANMTTAGNFENDGSLTIGAGSTLTITGVDTDTGTLTIPTSGTLNLLGGGSSSGNISNGGTLTLAAGAGFTSTGSYSQSGTVVVADTALFSLLGTFSNFDGATLSGGTCDILGTFQFNNAAVVTNAATLILDGPDALVLDQNGNDGLGGSLAANATGASLTI